MAGGWKSVPRKTAWPAKGADAVERTTDIMEDELILVDYDDNECGSMGKLAVHEKHLLHRAFSVFIFNGTGEQVIIQKRADHKYHSGGLWANTCCSHPRAGEALPDAVSRRLREEAGIECPVKEAGSFIYYAPFADGLAEYEYDHVFVGSYDGAFVPDPAEAQEMKAVDVNWLRGDIAAHPEKYAPWFFTALRIALDYQDNIRSGQNESARRDWENTK